MKKISLLLLFVSLVFSSIAQPPNLPPWQTDIEAFSPMFSFLPNTSGAYFNSRGTLGTQLDTSCSGCRQSPLKLGIVKYITNRGGTKKDTASPAPIYGTGKITFSWQAYKASTTSTATPICIATLYQSSNGFAWVPVSGVASQTLTPTAVYSVNASPACNSFQFLDKGALFYYVGVAVTVDTASFQMQYYYQKSNFITK